MANLILTSGESVTFSTGTYNVFGTTAGAETLNIGAGSIVTLDASFNQGGDRVVLTGNASSYTAVRSGSSIVLTTGTGATASSITIPVGTVANNIVFGDATRGLVFNTTTNAVELGGQAITTTASTVNAGSAAIAGQAFLLTAGVDSFTGGAGDDTFTSVYDGTAAPGAGNTLTATDTLVGGAGTDSLNVTVTTAGNSPLGGANISGIEVVNFRTLANTTFDASTVTGLTNVNTNTGTGTLTVTNLAAGAAIGVIGNGTVVNGNVSFGYAANASAVTVNLLNGTVAGTTVTGAAASTATSATVNSAGAANALTSVDFGSNTNTLTTVTINAASNFTSALTAANYSALGAALTVTGAGTVSIGANGNFKSVDASTSTGGLTLTLDTVTTSFKGSQGNDTITTVTLATPAAGIIDAGAGTGDRLIVGAAADVASAALRGSYVNFEILQNDASAALNASQFAGITTVATSSDGGTFTGLSAGQAANIAVTATQAAGATYALTTATGTTDVLGLTLGKGTAANAATSVTGAALTVTGFEILNLVANPGAAAAVGTDRTSTIASFTGATLNQINLTGTAFSITDAATTVAATYNASALTGDGTVAGSRGLTLGGNLVTGSTVTGSGFIDTVNVGGTGSTYNLGAGNDAITITGALAAGATNTINGGDGTDTLTITGGATLIDAAFQNVTNVEVLTFTGDNAVSVTSGGFFNTNYNAAGITLNLTGLTSTAGTVDLTTFTGKATVTSGTAAGTGAQSVTTGSGNDVITVLGAATTLTVVSGAGNDTITVTGTAATTGAAVTGGTGVDTITFAAALANTAGANRISLTYATGDSTTTAFDAVSGFDLADGTLRSSTLDLSGTPTVAGNFTGSNVTGFSSAELTATNTNGIITFSGSSAAGLTVAQRIAAVDSLINTDNQTVAFVAGGNTYVFHDTPGSTIDTVVQLTGVVATSLVTAANTVTDGALYIA